MENDGKGPKNKTRCNQVPRDRKTSPKKGPENKTKFPFPVSQAVFETEFTPPIDMPTKTRPFSRTWLQKAGLTPISWPSFFCQIIFWGLHDHDGGCGLHDHEVVVSQQ